MSKITGGVLEKHQNKYLIVLLEKINNDEELLLHDGGVVIIDKDDSIIKELQTQLTEHKYLNLNLLNSIIKNKTRFKLISTIYGTQVKFNDLSKNSVNEQTGVLKCTGEHKTIETLQCLGVMVTENLTLDNFYFGSKLYYEIINILNSNNEMINVNHMINDIFCDEVVFTSNYNFICDMVNGMYYAMRDLNFNASGVIHKNLNEFHTIVTGENDIIKGNTSDCVVYTGDDFLKNLERYGVDICNHNSHLIYIKDDDTIFNSFYQVSLKKSKKGARLGDVKSLSDNGKIYQRSIFYESLRR